MRNLTLKRRFPRGVNVRKNDFIQLVSGKYVEKVLTPPPFPNHAGFETYLQSKPKAISFRNWVYPFCFQFCDFDEDRAEKQYQVTKEWHKLQEQDVDIYISGKMQHLTQCFDSKHFKTCGGNSRYRSCSNKIQNKNVFCIFVKDKAGHILARMILKSSKAKLYYYNLYGDRFWYTVFKGLLSKIADKHNLELICLRSFL